MGKLLETIAKALVDYPDAVQVHAVEGEHFTILELHVHPAISGE